MSSRPGAASDPPRPSRRSMLGRSALVTVGVAGAGVFGGSARATVRPNLGVDDASATVDGRIAGVAGRGDRLVAVGRDASGAGAAWVRRAAGPWRSVGAGFGTGAVPAGIAAYGGELLAVGSVDGAAATWASPDGSAWQPALADGPPGVLCGVTAAGGLVLAVGQAGDGETGEGAGALVLRSSDGRRWTTAATRGLPNGSETGLTAVAFYRGRWVTASHSIDGARLWQSSDGLDWRPAAAPARPGVVISGLGVAAGELVAVGSTIADTQPRLWVRRDGAWRDVVSVRRGAVASGVLDDVVTTDSDGSVLLIGTRAGQSVTVASDEF